MMTGRDSSKRHREVDHEENAAFKVGVSGRQMVQDGSLIEGCSGSNDGWFRHSADTSSPYGD